MTQLRRRAAQKVFNSAAVLLPTPVTSFTACASLHTAKGAAAMPLAARRSVMLQVSLPVPCTSSATARRKSTMP